jgi:hypothetical protein
MSDNKKFYKCKFGEACRFHAEGKCRSEHPGQPNYSSDLTVFVPRPKPETKACPKQPSNNRLPTLTPRQTALAELAVVAENLSLGQVMTLLEMAKKLALS